MTEPPLDLRTFFAILRRGRLAILIIALIGLCGGVVYGLHGHQQPSAVALVYVPPQTNNNSDALTDDMHTQVVIATSSPVVVPAITSISPPVSISDVKVTATAIGTTDILRIAVQAPQSGQAVQAANSIATSYANYAKKNGLVSSPPILLQPASKAVSTSARHRLTMTVPMGLVAGVLVGVVVVFLRSRRDRRLRRRDDIANALGLPVLATIEVGIYKSVGDWTRFLEEFEPSPTSLWNLRRVFYDGLPGPYDRTLMMRVVSYADDQPALAAGPQLAMAAAELGVATRIEPCMDDALAALRAAAAKLNRLGSIEPDMSSPQPPGNRLHETVSGERATDGTQLLISILAVNRSSPTLPPFAGRTVLAVSAGAAISDDLARLALAATEGESGIDGVIVVNPEPGDAGASGLHRRAGNTQTSYMVNDSPAPTSLVHPS